MAGTQTTAKWNICVYDSDSTTTSTLLATAGYTPAVRPRISAIIPASSPASGGQSITVAGAGFSAASNATTATIGGAALTNIKVAPNGRSFTDPSAHVFLVKDAYVAATNRGVQECRKVLVVNNTELICTLDLLGDRLTPEGGTTSGPVAEGTYTVTVVANGATDAGDAANPTIVSSGSTFTVSQF